MFSHQCLGSRSSTRWVIGRDLDLSDTVNRTAVCFSPNNLDLSDAESYYILTSSIRSNMPLPDVWPCALWSLCAGAAAGCRCQVCGRVRFGFGCGAAAGCRCQMSAVCGLELACWCRRRVPLPNVWLCAFWAWVLVPLAAHQSHFAIWGLRHAGVMIALIRSKNQPFHLQPGHSTTCLTLRG